MKKVLWFCQKTTYSSKRISWKFAKCSRIWRITLYTLFAVCTDFVCSFLFRHCSQIVCSGLHIVLSAPVAGSYIVICYQVLVQVVQTFLRSISENFKKYFLRKILNKIFENIKNFFGKFREIFRKIWKIIPRNFEKYFGKINQNYKILGVYLITR